ncbi:beta-1-syntrophin isoform X2 [Athalia rosae]|uniref:beta-1-syntrophin isoform X2 n=1 Tax=Athalia rosae TaxID=37344 RepID=UPI00203418EA|nr:beta-1-syntrophin isoform X2 [Athalia rosae]
MVCDAAGSGCPSEIVEEDVSLRRALEDLLKCMLRVWCKEGQALTKLGVSPPESDKRVIVKREPGGEFGFRIHGSKPVVVSVIEPDKPAESSGLEVGDIIISVNGRSVVDAVHSEVVRLAHSGSDVLELEVVRTCTILQAPQASRGGSKEGSVEPPLYSGYLWRRATSSNSSTSDKWVRRWFALRRDNCLYCYKTDADSQPVGAVMLLKYAVMLTPDVRPHSFAISKPGAPTLHLGADTEDAANRWATVIKEAVEKNNQGDTWVNASLRLQQMPPCTIQRPDCFGYLSKQQQAFQSREFGSSWSRRYCVLKDAVLYFYDDANAERAFGIACVRGYSVHWGASGSDGRKHAFELQPPDSAQKSHIFATESEMDKKRWIAALEYSIDRWIKIG